MTVRNWILLAAIAGLVLWGGETAVDKYVESVNEKQFGPMADSISDRLGLDRNIFRAIIRQESGWKPTAVNEATKDYGLAQINLITAKAIRIRLGRKDALPDALLSPEVNFIYAADLLREIKGAGMSTPEDFFHSWNVGWPAYRKGTRSPYIAGYVSAFETYSNRGVA